MLIPFEQLRAELERVLLKNHFTAEKAHAIATIFAENSCDGVYTHGLNRFPTFVQYAQQGHINIEAEPVCEAAIGSLERWNGNCGPGMLNARICMDRAITLAQQHGIGCVAIRNTNHWMRGGTYGWQAANAGCIGMCFTNTIANLPPWGGLEPRLGNNPLIIAVPNENGHIVLDMAVSQYSFGKLLQYRSWNEQLPLPGGYDAEGNLSTNLAAIIDSGRLLPIGFWKGSALSLMLDLLVTILSQGRSTAEVTKDQVENGVSQVFICFKAEDNEHTRQLIDQIISFAKSGKHIDEEHPFRYPGESVLKIRQANLRDGIPVDEKIWAQVLAL